MLRYRARIPLVHTLRFAAQTQATARLVLLYIVPCPLRKFRPNLLFLAAWAGLSDTLDTRSECLPFMTFPLSGCVSLAIGACLGLHDFRVSTTPVAQ